MEELQPYVAGSTIALAEHVFPSVNSASGLAELIVSQYGAAGVLREASLRLLVVDKLGISEAVELCRHIDLPVVEPAATLKRCFTSLNGTAAKTLFEWLNIPYQANAVVGSEPSRKARPNGRLRRHQTAAFRELRQRLSDATSDVLLHMPPGSGKLRTVATAIVDLLRSSPENQTVIWCASDVQLCEAAFSEIFDVWTDLGTRDVTIYRLFGAAPMQDLQKICGGVAILDLARLKAAAALDPNELKEFAKDLRCVVLNDAQHVSNPLVQQVFQTLRKAGSFNLVGLFSASGAYMHSSGLLPVLRQHYGSPPIELVVDDPIAFLVGENIMSEISFIIVKSVGTLAQSADVDINADGNIAFDLAHDVQRNHQLIEYIAKRKHQGESIVFHANTAGQARAFVGILNYYGIKAVSVTDEMEFEQQRQEVKRFQNGTDTHVLCVHGALVSGNEVLKAKTMIVASPTSSTALYGAMVGQFASGRSPGAILDVITVDDGIAGFSGLIAQAGKWQRMETTR